MSQELTTERLLSLRAVPIFSILPINDLQVIARYTNDREFRAGQVLQKANEMVDRIHILTHGQVEIHGPGDLRRVEDAPFAVGVFPVLAQRSVDFGATAVTRVRAVELDGRRLGDLFDDYPRLLLQAIKQTAGVLLANTQSHFDFAVKGSPLEQAAASPVGKLDLVEKIFFLRQVLPLERISIDALASTARALTSHTFEAGERIWSRGDRGDAILLLVRGQMEAALGPQRVIRDMPGSLGGIEALAGAKRWYHLYAKEKCETLGLPVDIMLDAFEEHTDMGLDFLAFLSTLMIESISMPAAVLQMPPSSQGPTLPPAPLPLDAPPVTVASPGTTLEPAVSDAANETVES